MDDKFDSSELSDWIDKLWLAYQTHESLGIFEGSNYHRGYMIKEYLKRLVQKRDWSNNDREHK